ncbi:MAG: hypothetical protein LBI28_02695 [Treponema sp.]|jgi:tetratricopeptide (TPR) repeat protein|nr:hypothetical protein [Treponema sp.]
MLNFSKRFIYALSNKVRQKDQAYSPERKFTINFARTKKSPFEIKSESSYNAYLSKGSFELGIKKPNCIAWADLPDKEYKDHIIEAKIRLDSLGGYAATGIIFRIMDDESYYMALVSSKGYFRLDVVKNNSPKPLIAWSEIAHFDGVNVRFKIITYGTCLIFLVNGKWLGEVNDNLVAYGRLGFALASYEDTGNTSPEMKKIIPNKGSAQKEESEYVCKARLDFISVDTRTRKIEEEYKKWTTDSNINAEERLHLAETFAVMGEPVKALEQINKAWKRRDDVINVVVGSSEVRTKRELLLAARMSFRLLQYSEAEEFIDSILDQWPDSAEGILAHTEKLKILNELNKFKELKEFVIKYQQKINKDVDYYTLYAKCNWELKDYAESATAWDKAFEMNKENGVFAANAANAHEAAGSKRKALVRFIIAGKLFLNQDNNPELGALMPKLAALGKRNWEARTLMGKWAFSIEDYEKCVKEFSSANKLRCAMRPRPKGDPALFYLWGLVYYIKGKRKTAIGLLERAVKLAPDYELFRTKLEELKSANNGRS